MMDIVMRELRRGRSATIFAMGTNEDCQVLEFLKDLAESNGAEAARTWALIDHTVEHGAPKNKEKCRFFAELKLFELKTRGGVRIMAFWDKGKLIVCSHAFLKKSTKTPKRELVRAKEARKRYFDSKQRGRLIFE
jgi:phage-related protein